MSMFLNGNLAGKGQFWYVTMLEAVKVVRHSGHTPVPIGRLESEVDGVMVSWRKQTSQPICPHFSDAG